jgi:hypothetical protein
MAIIVKQNEVYEHDGHTITTHITNFWKKHIKDIPPFYACKTFNTRCEAVNNYSITFEYLEVVLKAMIRL